MLGWLKRIFRGNKPPVDIKEIESVIGYRFADPFLLYRSLKHRSYSQVMEGSVDLSNERLEFLGDSVLNMVVSHTLYVENQDYQEGDLTKLKSVLVSKSSADLAARNAGLERFILLSNSEEDAGGRDRTSIIADTYEAIIGAIFLDGGFEAAQKFIQKTILDDIDTILDNTDDNFKSFLLELTQGRKLGHPSYRTISEEGPDHDKVFTVEVAVQGKPYGIGKGKTKKTAQQMAAKDCLEKRQYE